MDVSTFDSGSGRVDSYRCHAERYYNGLERSTEIEPLMLGRVFEKCLEGIPNIPVPTNNQTVRDQVLNYGTHHRK